MVDASANLKLTGSGDLNKYLESLNENMTGFNKSTDKQSKSFKDLNKIGGETTSLFEKLTKSSKQLLDNSREFVQDTRSFVGTLKDVGSATIKLDETLAASTKGVKGLGLGFVGLKDEVQLLNSVIDGPAAHFRDIAEAQGATAKAFVILDKTSKPIITTIKTLGNQLEKVDNLFRNAEIVVADFAKGAIGAGAKSLEFFSQTVQNLSKNLKESSLFGRVISKSFDGVAKTLDDSAKSARTFQESIDPKELKKVDAAGERLAGTFDGLGNKLANLATGVYLADLVGDLTRTTEKAKDFAAEIGNNVVGAVQGAGTAVKAGIPFYTLMFTKMNMLQHAATGLNIIFKDQLTKSIAGFAGALGGISLVLPMMGQLAAGASDAYLQAKGLNDTFTVMQNLGIDTTAASIAFQFGLVGEKLLLSSQAAKQFGQTAIQAFAQLEDAAAFVTTIGAGASVELEGMEAGVESVSAAMTELSGKLNNAVSSVEATNALYNALSAGVGVAADGTVRLAETNEFLAASLKLSAGSGANAAQTLELLAKTSKVYGISNSEAADTAAKLYQIVEQGITTFPELTGVLGNVFSVAKSVGVSMEEVGGSVAALTKIMGSAEAATGLQSLLASIAGQGAQAQKALQDLGIRFDINTIKSKGLIESLNELYAATGGNASQIREIIPDITAFRTALALMTSASEDAVETTQRLTDAGEEQLDELFERRQQSTIQQFTLIMNGFNEVLSDFGRRVLPSIQPGVDFLQTLLNVLQNLPEPIKNVIGAIVIAQTAVSNIGGGLLSFGLTIAQVVGTLTAFRLASKLMGGQLGKEIDVLKAINSAGFDFSGTLLRLIGLNEKFDVETAKANATLKQQEKLLKQLSNNEINFDGSVENVRDLGTALKDTKSKIKELQSGGLQDTNPVQFDKQIKSLKRLENSIASTIKQTTQVRRGIFKDLQQKIDRALSDTSLTVDQRKATLQKSLNNYFNTFSDTGKKAKAEIQTVFENILGNAELTTEQKIASINSTFKEIAEDATPSVRRSLARLQGELLEAAARLDGKFNGEISALVTKLNLELREIGNSKVVQDVSKNLNKVRVEVTKQTGRMAKEVGLDSKKVNNSLGKVGRAFGSVGDLVSNFVPGAAPLINVFRDTVDAAEDIEDAMPRVGKSTKVAKKGFGELSRSVFNTQVNVANMKGLFGNLGKVFAGGAKGAGIFAVANAALGGAAGVAAGGIGALTTAIGSLWAAAWPIAAVLGVVAGAAFGLFKIMQKLIPAFGEATDGTLKLAKNLRTIAEDTDKSTEAVRRFADSLGRLDALAKMQEFDGFFSEEQRAAAAKMSDQDLEEIYGFSEEQVRRIRDNTIEAITPEEKAFVQGWRAPLLNLFEFVSKQITTLDNKIAGFAINIGKQISQTLENIPIIGGVFDKVSDSFDRMLFRVRKSRKEEESNLRKFVNNLRENIQAGIAAPAREAALQSRDAMQGLLLETGKLNTAYEEGGVAYGKSSEIIAKATNENRALRGKELQQILAEEKELNSSAREEIQKNIEARQEELEKAKDPVVRKELESQIEFLQERNTELEKGIALQEKYLSNVNALLNARDQNRADQGLSQLEDRVKLLYADLSEEGKEVFKNLPGAALDAAGEIETITGRLTSGAQRRAQASFEAARASFSETVGSISDPSADINPDKVGTDLFNVLDAIDKQVAEDVIDLDRAKAAKEQFLNQIIEIEVDGQVQRGFAKEFLRVDQVKAVEENLIETSKNVAERNISIKQDEISIIKALEEQNLKTGIESAKEIADANEAIGEERIALEKNILDTLEELYGTNSQAATDQRRKLEVMQNEIAAQGFNDRKKILDEELNLLQQQKDNEIKVIENAANKEKALLDIREKTINLDQSALGAQQELTAAIASLEQSSLQNKLKFTQDIEEKAQIELEIAQDRLVALDKEQQFERENLELQQELNRLALERQKIELNLQAAQLDTQKIIAESKLQQADQLNLTEEEVLALQLQVQALTQQKEAIGASQQQLVKQGQTQEIINQKQRQSLELRQEAAKQSTAADVELARIAEVNAGYEKQKQQIQTNAKLDSLAGQEKLQAVENQEAILNSQTDVLQKQYEIVKETGALQERYYGIAKNTAANEFQRRRIEREEAKARLKNLEKMQEIERFNLQIEQMKRDVALQIQQIKLETSIIEKEASLATARAEQARVEADPTATDEQRAAAGAAVRAEEVGIEGLNLQRGLLEQQRGFNEFLNRFERAQQEDQFEAQELEARQNLASTTRGRSDDRRVNIEAQRRARESGSEFGQLADEFSQAAQGFLGGTPATNPSFGSVSPASFSRLAPAASSGRQQQFQGFSRGAVVPSTTNQMQVGGNISISLDIKGEGAAKLDKDQLRQVASDSLYKGLQELFDYSQRRQNGGSN